jgi:hypothetical protein
MGSCNTSYSASPSAISKLVPICHIARITSREKVMYKDRRKGGEKEQKNGSQSGWTDLL